MTWSGCRRAAATSSAVPPTIRCRWMCWADCTTPNCDRFAAAPTDHVREQRCIREMFAPYHPQTTHTPPTHFGSHHNQSASCVCVCARFPRLTIRVFAHHNIRYIITGMCKSSVQPEKEQKPNGRRDKVIETRAQQQLDNSNDTTNDWVSTTHWKWWWQKIPLKSNHKKNVSHI